MAKQERSRVERFYLQWADREREREAREEKVCASVKLRNPTFSPPSQSSHSAYLRAKSDNFRIAA
jgi:hypothetical protein